METAPRPPVKLSTLVASTLWAMTARLPKILVLAAIAFAPLVAWHGIMAATDAPEAWWRYAALIVQSLSSAVLSASITYLVVRRMRGQPASTADALRAARRRLLPVLLVGVVTTLLILVAAVALVIPALVAICWSYVAVPVTVVEEKGIFASISRSGALTRGSRWTIFKLCIVVCLCWVAAFLAIGLWVGPSPGYGRAATAVGGFLLVMSVFHVVAAAVTYETLREHTEGPAGETLARVFE